MITVEIDRIRIERECGEVIYLTREGARDLQEQLDDILGPAEPGSVEPGSVEPGSVEPGSVEPGSVEPGPFTVTADPLTVKWDSGTAIEIPCRITSSPPTASPWDFM